MNGFSLFPYNLKVACAVGFYNGANLVFDTFDSEDPAAGSGAPGTVNCPLGDGDTSAERADDSVFAKLYVKQYDDLRQHLNQLACTNVDSGGGASLAPLGGQNPLEAAVWGKVVLYGPSMEDFKDAKQLLESVGAGIKICDAETLAQKALWLLDHPEALATPGERARQLIKRNQGAAQKHARVIEGLL